MSSYKFMKVSRFYPGFLKSYYKENIQLPNQSYKEQLAHLMDQGFGWSDYMSRALIAQGVECLDVVANAEHLQRTWANENSSKSIGAALVLEQIQKFKPDVLLVQDTVTLDAHWCKRIREKVPGIRVLAGWHCAPYTASDFELFKQFDLLITCSPMQQEDFNSQGIFTTLLHHCFEPTLYKQYGVAHSLINQNQVLFAGSVTLNRGYHLGRLRFLKDLSVAGIPLVIHAEQPSVAKNALKSALGLVAQGVDALPGLSKIKARSIFSRAVQWSGMGSFSSELKQLSSCWKEPLYASRLLRKISQVPISLNFHIDSTGEYAGNARLFEVTGMGSCLVTDEKKNLFELFEPDKEVVTYRSTEECIEKTRWLLDHPVERARIAEAGRRRCHEDHNFAVRAQALNEVMVSMLKS